MAIKGEIKSIIRAPTYIKGEESRWLYGLVEFRESPLYDVVVQEHADHHDVHYEVGDLDHVPHNLHFVLSAVAQ